MFCNRDFAFRLCYCLLACVVLPVVGCGGGDEAAQMSKKESTASRPNDPPPDGLEPMADEPLEAAVEQPLEPAYEAPIQPATEALPPPEPGEREDTQAFPRVTKSPPRAMAARSTSSERPAGDIEDEQPKAETGAHLVQVFYATDRRPLTGISGRFDLATYAAAIVSGFVALLLLIATVFLRRRIVLALLTAAAVIVTAQLVHTAVLNTQKERRLVEKDDRLYGSERHELAGGYQLELGVCHVNIPPDHRVGKVESPSILRLEFREDPKRHVILERVILKPENEFYDELGARIQESADKEAFVFVHGYNVTFEGAVKRTAQIAHDLRFDGAPICYSWPSRGGLAEYTRDEANVTWTVVHLEEFLGTVVQNTGAQTVHLVAHSMGNRALLQALERMALKQSQPGTVFGQVVLAAPDVDAGEFRDRYAPAVARMARQVTLYASSNDQALVASTTVHGHTRAGLSGDSLVVAAGVDTIDVSPIDTSLIGHSYYGDNPQMIRDLQAIVELGEPASARSWLQQIASPSSLAYWVFRQELEGSLLDVGRGSTSPEMRPMKLR